MDASSDWQTSRPVAFASILCMLMLGGEIVSGDAWNPMALVFYCFLPAALWMISRDQKRDAGAIDGLRARIDDLERAQRGSALTTAE